MKARHHLASLAALLAAAMAFAWLIGLALRRGDAEHSVWVVTPSPPALLAALSAHDGARIEGLWLRGHLMSLRVAAASPVDAWPALVIRLPTVMAGLPGCG